MDHLPRPSPLLGPATEQSGEQECKDTSLAGIVLNLRAEMLITDALQVQSRYDTHPLLGHSAMLRDEISVGKTPKAICRINPGSSQTDNDRMPAGSDHQQGARVPRGPRRF